MSVSAEFTCPCGKTKNWITEGKELPTPCPFCGRRFKGQYNPETLTVDAVVIEGAEPLSAVGICAGTQGNSVDLAQNGKDAMVSGQRIIPGRSVFLVIRNRGNAPGVTNVSIWADHDTALHDWKAQIREHFFNCPGEAEDTIMRSASEGHVFTHADGFIELRHGHVIAKVDPGKLEPKMAYVEVVLEGSPDSAIRAEVDMVPYTELEAAVKKYEVTKECPCRTIRRFVFDLPGGMYTHRFCSVCKRFLGLV